MAKNLNPTIAIKRINTTGLREPLRSKENILSGFGWLLNTGCGRNFEIQLLSVEAKYFLFWFTPLCSLPPWLIIWQVPTHRRLYVRSFVRLLLQIISKPFFISWKRMKTKDNTKVWNELEFLAFLLFVFYFFNTPRKWDLFIFVIYSRIYFNISQRHRWFGCQVSLFLLR